MEIEVNVPKNYDLLASVHSWIFPGIQPVPEVTFEGGLRRVYTIQGNPTGLTLLQERPGETIRILYDNERITKDEIIAKVRQTLNLDFNMKPVLRAMKAVSSLEEIATKIKGVRPYLADTPFEALIKAILQQQISYQAANVITRRMVEKLGNTPQHGEPIYSFPSASKIISVGTKGLKEFGVGYKTECVLNLCELVESKDVDLDELHNMSYEEIVPVLKPIRGIGEWTIQALSIAGLADYTVFPFGDLAIQKILGKIIADGRRLTKQEVTKFAEARGEVGTQILYLLMCADALGLIDDKPHGEFIKGEKLQ